MQSTPCRRETDEGLPQSLGYRGEDGSRAELSNPWKRLTGSILVARTMSAAVLIVVVAGILLVIGLGLIQLGKSKSRYCATCGQYVQASRNFSNLVFLFLFVFTAGTFAVLYLLYCLSKPRTCPVCGGTNFATGDTGTAPAVANPAVNAATAGGGSAAPSAGGSHRQRGTAPQQTRSATQPESAPQGSGGSHSRRANPGDQARGNPDRATGGDATPARLEVTEADYEIASDDEFTAARALIERIQAAGPSSAAELKQTHESHPLGYESARRWWASFGKRFVDSHPRIEQTSTDPRTWDVVRDPTNSQTGRGIDSGTDRRPDPRS